MQVTAEHSPNDHPYRGYAIVNNDSAISDVQEIKSSATKRPVYFVCNGMGSQWNGMGRSLMELEIFRNSIMKLEAAMKPYSFSVYDLLMKDDPAIFDNPQFAFMGINAIQV